KSRGPVTAIFGQYSLGVGTHRDALVYSYNKSTLPDRVKIFIELYNATVDQLKRSGNSVDDLIDTADSRIKWTRQVKSAAMKLRYSEYAQKYVRSGLYRPFTNKYRYFDDFWNEERYKQPVIFPTEKSEVENLALCVSGVGSERPFAVYISRVIPDLNFFGPGTVPQWFPFYTYAEDGSNRRENITEWALKQFQEQYGPEVTKRDIFHYVYGVLHSPQYRERYAENLKRELPRILFVGPKAFPVFVETGARLADIHLNYEQAKEYQLQWLENKDVPFSWRVTKMQLSKDKTQIKVNESLTLAGIPAECFAYRLGNRSALEWVIDQYQVSTDKRSSITSDPNRADDEEYIVRLVGRVVTVSVETVKLVEELVQAVNLEAEIGVTVEGLG
ncbi:MAG: type ISP restriction/modification enzyme, partial [Ktedonobacteraceae bacterium]